MGIESSPLAGAGEGTVRGILMQILRMPWFVRLVALIVIGGVFWTPTVEMAPQQQQQRLVEAVDVQGNRRISDDAILYYVQTRPGDPYNEQQVQRDFQAIMALGWFDKTASRVLVQDGPRGGVEVIFEVKELPIIRDLQFEGLKAVTEADVLKAFREARVGVSKESIYDPVKVRNATRIIKELLAARGYPNATVEVKTEEVSATSTAVTFVVNQGERVRVVEIDFVGNRVFKDGELRSQMKYVKESGLISRFRGQDILDTRKLDEDRRRVELYMRSKGYLQARTGEPRVEGIGRRKTGFFIPLPLLSSTDDALRVTIPVVEGKIYRIGDIKIEGNSILSEQYIQNVIGLNKGDIANGERIGKAIYEDLKRVYGTQGFLQYEAELEPSFRDNPQNPNEGIADFTIKITEGRQFTLRRLEFLGNTFTRDYVLRREFLLNEGDVYNQSLFEYSIVRLNQLGFFDPIDKDKDADLRTNEEEGYVDINVKVNERGRQQISFNGGVSGIGGSFFGLEYSTNNLFGRGESLSFQLAAGNRQRSFLFSFTEPYVRNRPITAGFSLFNYSLKFFGEGTIFSQNPDAVRGIVGSIFDFINTGEENLFTQNTTGGSLFVSAPLSEFYRKRRFTTFSRIGLSYSISRTSIKEPPVNQQDPRRAIPVLYSQPDIVASRITPTFVYDTRDFANSNGVDPTNGKQISFSLGFSGLGGDVRTYQPLASYTQYIPVRRKGRGQKPEVFAFRILAGHIGSFSVTPAVRNANSLAFVDGVPIYERFFLGDEFTIRGYNVRSISPLAPLDTYVTSRNVVVASNAAGAPQPIPELQRFASLGVFTGPSGNSPLVARSFQYVGADTQLLGNFEYRIPLFGPVSLAAFADIGSAFNLRKGRDQFITSNFLADTPFLPGTLGVSLTSLAATQNPNLATVLTVNGLAFVANNERLLTKQEFQDAVNAGQPDPQTGLPPGLRAVFLRGEAQTNTVVRLSQSAFSKFGDFRSSVGLELRVQIPVVNVPFRLIYAFNPNARRELNGVPLLYPGRAFRFSIGRTF